MLAFVTSPFALLLWDVGLRGALCTREKEFLYAGQQPNQFLYQYPQPSQVSQQQLNSLLSQPLGGLQQPFLSQPQAALQQPQLSQLSLLSLSQPQAGLQTLLAQPSQLPALDQLQANLGGFPGSSAQLPQQLPQQDFLQAQIPQQASLLQPLGSTGMDSTAGLNFGQIPQAPSFSQMSQMQNTAGNFDQTPQAPSFSQMSQMQNIMASVPIKEVVDLMHSVETLQKRTQGLEKQLSQAHMHEKQLNDAAYNAAARSNSIDESARKLASLAQASVTQAQKSVTQEKSMVESMKAHLKEVEEEKSELSKEKDELRTQLSEARTTVKRIEDREALESLQAESKLADQNYKLNHLALATASPAAQAQALSQAQALAQESPESFAQLQALAQASHQGFDQLANQRSAPSSVSYEPAMQELPEILAQLQALAPESAAHQRSAPSSGVSYEPAMQEPSRSSFGAGASETIGLQPRERTLIERLTDDQAMGSLSFLDSRR